MRFKLTARTARRVSDDGAHSDPPAETAESTHTAQRTRWIPEVGPAVPAGSLAAGAIAEGARAAPRHSSIGRETPSAKSFSEILRLAWPVMASPGPPEPHGGRRSHDDRAARLGVGGAASPSRGGRVCDPALPL